jgi:hypothetical protein
MRRFPMIEEGASGELRVATGPSLWRGIAAGGADGEGVDTRLCGQAVDSARVSGPTNASGQLIFRQYRHPNPRIPCARNHRVFLGLWDRRAGETTASWRSRGSQGYEDPTTRRAPYCQSEVSCEKGRRPS